MYRVTSTYNYFNHKTFCTVIILLLFIIFLFFNTYDRYGSALSHEYESPWVEFNKYNGNNVATPQNFTDRYSDMKYILLWTNPKNFPFIYFGEGQNVFIQKKCEWTNCYVTGDRTFLGDYMEFHAVAFNGPQLRAVVANGDLPTRRATSQKYVYANIESAVTYPVCHHSWDGYFNWTWTYRLDSDSIWRYFVVRDDMGEIIGPVKSRQWLKLHAMIPIDDDFKEKLTRKKKVAAWFVSNCHSSSFREDFVDLVQRYLQRYNMKVDVYGACGPFQCPKKIMSRCLKMLERDYYFYFAFENSLSEDYVTEKVLYALNHNTVPVVFGGANYSRFLPPGSYLNARLLGAAGLAEKMFELMQSPEQYQEMFRWKNHYSFHYTHEQPDSDVYCGFCAALNNPEIFNTSCYNDFSSWWTPKGACDS